jgi:hypothetical protein
MRATSADEGELTHALRTLARARCAASRIETTIPWLILSAFRGQPALMKVRTFPHAQLLCLVMSGCGGEGSHFAASDDAPVRTLPALAVSPGESSQTATGAPAAHDVHRFSDRELSLSAARA